MTDAPTRAQLDEALARADELIVAGDKPAALAVLAPVADGARALAAADPALAQLIGSVYELADELAPAQRWYTIGARALEKAGMRNAEFYLALLGDRYRVRRDAGLEFDAIDVETEELRRLAAR